MKLWYEKAGMLVLSFFLLVLIFKTLARSCFVGIFVYFVLMLLGLFGGKRKINRLGLWGVALAPLAIVFLYLGVLKTKWFTDAFSFLVMNGKKLNARNKIWLVALGFARNNLLIGNYSGISGGMGMSQLHNTHIDVLCSDGLPSMILFVCFLYECMHKVNEQIKTMAQYAAFCAFIGCICIGCFEAALVSGSTGLFFLTGGFLILAAANDEDENMTAIPLRNDHG